MTDATHVRRGGTVRRVKNLGWYALLGLLSVLVLFPVWMILMRALSQPISYLAAGQPARPVDPEWDVFRRAFVQGDLGRRMTISAVVTVIIATAQVVTSVLAAYAFAFLRFPFRNAVFALFMATLMLPIEVTLIANVETVRSLGWFNSYQGLTAPFLATAFGTFLIRQGFLGIPDDLRDAAELDGYGHLGFLWNVAVPAHPADHRLVHGHLVPVRVEPVPVAEVHHHPRGLGHHPDRPAQVREREHQRAQPRLCRGDHRGGAHLRDPRHLPAPPDPGPDRRCGQGMTCRPSSDPPRSIMTTMPPMTRFLRLLAVLMAGALIAAACGGDSGDSADDGEGAACPVDALDDADGPVEVTLWHTYVGLTNETLNKLADEYNASQDRVEVQVENQGASYEELLRKYRQGIPSGDLPTIGIMEDTNTQFLADSGTIIPGEVVRGGRRLHGVRRLQRAGEGLLQRRRRHAAGLVQRRHRAPVLQPGPLRARRPRPGCAAPDPRRDGRVRTQDQGRRGSSTSRSCSTCSPGSPSSG